MKHQIMVKGSVLALLLLAFVFTAPRVFASPATADSPEVTKLLADVKAEAVELRADTEDMKTFTGSTNLSWQSHSAKIEQIKASVNAAGRLLTKLHDAKASGSPWQQQAIDRITPLLQELASNTTKVIEHLNATPRMIHTAPYTDYVAANFDVATDLSSLISDYLEYGKAKAKSEQIGEELEVPGM